jgi:hypothetical protein
MGQKCIHIYKEEGSIETCQRDAYRGTDYCILHTSPDSRDKDAFLAAVRRELEKSDTETVDFRGVHFPQMNDLFSGRTFTEKALFDDAEFDSCFKVSKTIFLQGCSLDRAKFGKGAEWIGVTVVGKLSLDVFTLSHGKLIFKNLTVDGETVIRPGVISDPILISGKSVFKGKVHLRGTFGAAVLFEDAAFENDLIVSGCAFQKVLTFKRVILEQRGVFTDSAASNGLSFTDVEFCGETVFSPTHLVNCEPQFIRCNLAGVRCLTLPDSLFRDPKKLSENILNCTWPRELPGRLRWDRCHAADETDIAPFTMFIRLKAWLIKKGTSLGWSRAKRKALTMRAAKDQARLHRLSQIYRQLHKKYYSESRFTEAAEFYVSFMTAKRKAETRKLWARTLDLLYAVLSKYGESIARPLSLLGITWVGGTLWWLYLGVKDCNGQSISCFFTVFCANVAAALFFRTASYIPGQFTVQSNILIVESFLTILFLGFLALAVRRQFAPKTPMD